MRCRSAIALVGVLGLALAGCGGGSSGGSAGARPQATAYAGPVGPGEGKLSVLAWPGYAEDGSTDPKIDWVTPFEQQTGCQVSVKTFATSAEAVQLFSTGEYDVVSASGDASLRLVYGDRVQPVNTGLVPNYADIFPDLKDKPWNSVGGVSYGIPHGRGANLLLYNLAENPTPPTSWSGMWDANSPEKGKISPYDDAIYIADAAVYLMSTQPDLAIKNPYALDQKQFDAAIALLKQQKPLVNEYWGDYIKQSQGLTSGAIAQGQGWQLTANLANTDDTLVGTAKPKEGATGWSDTWMIKKDTPNINCSYLWLNHIVSPQVNAQIAEYFGEAPSNEKSCALTTNKDHCTQYHAADTAFWTDVYYWTTPTENCLDGRPALRRRRRTAAADRHGGLPRDDPAHGCTGAAVILSSTARWTLRTAAGLVLAFIYVPLLLVGVNSFSTSVTFTWPPPGYTLKWWQAAASNEGVRTAVVTSVQVAAAATVIAVVLGTLASMALVRYSFFGRSAVSLLVLLPIALPGIVTGIALNTLFTQALGGLTFFTLVAGHATFCIVIVVNNASARLRRMSSTPEEASTDLGAGPWTTWRLVTFPALRGALVAGALLAFALSFDEIIVTTFTAGPGLQTLPLWIFQNLFRPNQSPVVNVAAVVLVVVSVVPVYLANRLSGDSAGAVTK